MCLNHNAKDFKVLILSLIFLFPFRQKYGLDIYFVIFLKKKLLGADTSRLWVNYSWYFDPPNLSNLLNNSYRQLQSWQRSKGDLFSTVSKSTKCRSHSTHTIGRARSHDQRRTPLLVHEEYQELLSINIGSSQHLKLQIVSSKIIY